MSEEQKIVECNVCGPIGILKDGETSEFIVDRNCPHEPEHWSIKLPEPPKTEAPQAPEVPKPPGPPPGHTRDGYEMVDYDVLPEPMKSIVGWIRTSEPESIVFVSPPEETTQNWIIIARKGKRGVMAEVTPSQTIALYLREEQISHSRPDEIYQKPDAAAVKMLRQLGAGRP